MQNAEVKPSCEKHRLAGRKAFQVMRLEIRIPDLPHSFNGFKMVQLTDLHYGPCTSLEHINHAIELTRQENPNLVLLTGDYIQYSSTGVSIYLSTRFNSSLFRWSEYRRNIRALAEDLGNSLAQLSPDHGMIAVFGNHDYVEGAGSIRRKFPSTIKWLVNSSTSVTHSDGSLLFIGLDDLRYGEPEIGLACESIKALDPAPLKPTVKFVLSHSPDLILLPDFKQLDEASLILCGHTHGGQIRIPGFGPVLTRTKQKDHYEGLCWVDKVPMYISNGVGYGGLPIRLFCPPEIVVVTLHRG